MKKEESVILSDAYSIISELWCNPQDVNREELVREAEAMVSGLRRLEKTLPHTEELGQAAGSLAAFIGGKAVGEEEYIGLFELEPKCPVYLGSHSFEEPKTCAGAGVSDRNDYMIELSGIYRHFGQAISGNELPDYLPLVIDFLSLTVKSRDDYVRVKLINEYITPFLSPMRKRLEELDTPYIHLFDAMEKLIGYEARLQPPQKEGEEKQSPQYRKAEFSGIDLLPVLDMPG